MEARILKQDGGLGKRIYECDVPADMYALRRKLKKTLIGVGQWRNIPEKYISILVIKNRQLFINQELLESILEWMDEYSDAKSAGK